MLSRSIFAYLDHEANPKLLRNDEKLNFIPYYSTKSSILAVLTMQSMESISYIKVYYTKCNKLKEFNNLYKRLKKK